MKRFCLSVFLAWIGLAKTTFAVEPAKGLYAGIVIGGSVTQKTSVALTNPGTIVSFLCEYTSACNGFSPSGTLTYSPLGVLGAQVGYRLHRYRAELEFIYHYNPYNKLQLGDVVFENTQSSSGLSIDGHTETSAGFLNGYYDLVSSDIFTRIIPYIGVGIGYARVSNNNSFYFSGTEIIRTRIDAITKTPIWQAILGASYYLDDYNSFSMDYRYLAAMQDIQYRLQGFNLNQFDSPMQIHSINFTYNGTFNGI